MSSGPDERPVAGEDADLIVGALYAMAADPTEWEQLLESMRAQTPAPADQLRLAAMVSGGERVAELSSQARLASEFADGAQPAVWVISAADQQVARNSQAAAAPLTALLAGAAPDQAAERRELLRAARARLRGTAGGATLMSVSIDDTRLPVFAYVMNLAELPLSLRSGLKPALGEARGALALVAPSTPPDPLVWNGLTEAFGLTPAEVRLAGRLCEGVSLRDAALDLNVSVNTVRNQLTAIFEKTGVNRQSELVRALSELGPLSRRIGQPVRRTKVPWVDPAPEAESIRLPDGRRLLFREYGPPRGRPVLLFHGGLGASLMPPGTGEACERLGLRLIAPERPGVGGSDPHPDHSIAAVAEDLAWLAAQLVAGPVQFCSFTSGSRFAAATAACMPGGVSRILMLSPRTPSEDVKAAEPAQSPMVRLQRRIKTHPWLAESIIAIMRMRLSRRIVGQMMQANAVSAGDAAWLAEHPETVDQITLALTEAMRLTSRGTADEIRQAGAHDPALDARSAPPITVWLGAEDAYTTEADIASWLGPCLTELKLMPAIGNYMVLKHWHGALAWLAGANDPTGLTA